MKSYEINPTLKFSFAGSCNIEFSAISLKQTSQSERHLTGEIYLLSNDKRAYICLRFSSKMYTDNNWAVFVAQ